MDTIEKENFYSPEDLAKKFRVSLSSIYKLIRGGELPSIRLGKVYRIPATDLGDYLAGKELWAKPSAASRKKIPEVVQRLIGEVERSKLSKNIREIRLFGSYARGDYHIDSDVDLLVVFREKSLEHSKELSALAERAMETVDYQDLLSLHEMSEDEWARMREGKYLLAQSIEREGFVVWKNR